jgi:hypothetical protein
MPEDFDTYCQPEPDHYMHDWWQLGFVLIPEEWEKIKSWWGMSIYERWGYGVGWTCNVMYIPIFRFKEPFNLEKFLNVWWHEYLHIIGLGEKQIHFLNINGKFIIDEEKFPMDEPDDTVPENSS